MESSRKPRRVLNNSSNRNILMFAELIAQSKLHKPDDKGRMSGRADTVRPALVLFHTTPESLPPEIHGDTVPSLPLIIITPNTNGEDCNYPN